MNIFYLDSDPIQSAQWLVDDHIRKMQIESAQLLCSTHWLNGRWAPYKLTHSNHPCSKWVRESIHHYDWVLNHGLEICKEFKLRYGKDHATQQTLEWLKINKPNLPDIPFKEPPLCMEDGYKLSEGVVESYRNYYIKNKIGIKKLDWNKIPSKKPNWI